MRRLLLALALLVLAPSAQAYDPSKTTWSNRRGSVMGFGNFWTPSTGWTWGYYISNQAPIPANCRGKLYALAGYIVGGNVNLRAAWPQGYAPECNVTTIWTGRIIDIDTGLRRRMCTTWTATMPSGQVISGTDTFWFVLPYARRVSRGGCGSFFAGLREYLPR
jgi:hypothetical protein